MDEGLMLGWSISCFSVAVFVSTECTFLDMKQTRPEK